MQCVKNKTKRGMRTRSGRLGFGEKKHTRRTKNRNMSSVEEIEEEENVESDDDDMQLVILPSLM